MTLEKRRIGTTNIEVTTLGFGGAPIGKADLGTDQAVSIIQRAYEGGIRYFDTAPVYGRGASEQRIGAGLSPLPRDEVVLSTKVGRLLVPAKDNPGHNQAGGSAALTIRYDYSYAGARQSLEASLRRLGLDRVDILLCHDLEAWTHGQAQLDTFETAVKGILTALNDLRDEGVIGAFGLGVNDALVCSQVLDRCDVDCFLLAGRFTLLEQTPLDDLLPQCLERNVSVIIGGPYNSGLLATMQREQATYNYRPVDDERWGRAQQIRQICDKHQIDMRAAALQYPLLHPVVVSVIPGSASLLELEANLDLVSAPIPVALWSDLDAAGLARALV